jgi:hypothetical protein
VLALSKHSAKVKLMPDKNFICSNDFLNKCISWLETLSRAEAKRMIDQGYQRCVKEHGGNEDEHQSKAKGKKGNKGK